MKALSALLVGLAFLCVASSAGARPRVHHRHHAHHHVHYAKHHAHRAPVIAQRPLFTFGNSGLVSKARGYIGTNPTGWAHVWCGKFMALIAPGAAARIGNANWALNWAKLQHTTPHVGAIAVLGRRGGGHVGVVSGFDPSGNPTIIAGNAAGHKVREYTVDVRRVVAWVNP